MIDNLQFCLAGNVEVAGFSTGYATGLSVSRMYVDDEMNFEG
jgi:hypothetical protein